jgi:hypothetical protein
MNTNPKNKTIKIEIKGELLSLLNAITSARRMNGFDLNPESIALSALQNGLEEKAIITAAVGEMLRNDSAL